MAHGLSTQDIWLSFRLSAWKLFLIIVGHKIGVFDGWQAANTAQEFLQVLISRSRATFPVTKWIMAESCPCFFSSIIIPVISWAIYANSDKWTRANWTWPSLTDQWEMPKRVTCLQEKELESRFFFWHKVHYSNLNLDLNLLWHWLITVLTKMKITKI